jgi:hypothetical protein
MKAVICGLVVLLVAAGASSLNGQGHLQPGAPINTPALHYDVRSGPTQYLELPSEQTTIRTKNFEVSGPLVRPLKEKRFRNGLKRFAQLFNPLAPAEPPQPITRIGRLSSQPWTATVGWNPGQSAFLNERTDVPTLTLLSVAPRK